RPPAYLLDRLDPRWGRRSPQSMRRACPIVQSRQAFATVPINPFSNGPRADAYSLRDGLRRLPALDLQYNPLSTARRQPGILMHVHPVLRWNLKLQQPQLPRSEPDGQPTESSQLACTHKRGIGRMSALGANRTRRDGGNDVNDPQPT